MFSGKIWGETEEIFNNSIVSVNVLHIKKGYRCSRHIHQSKRNHFYCISGKIEIIQNQDRTELRPGQSTFIPEGIEHYFIGLQDSVIIEIYDVKLSEDIVRLDSGESVYENK